MKRLYLYSRQILNAILFVTLILAFVLNNNSDLGDFFIGVATSIAFVNFINSLHNRKKEKFGIDNNKD